MEHPQWGDVYNLIESTFVSNKNMRQFQGTQGSRKIPGASWNIQTKEFDGNGHPHVLLYAIIGHGTDSNEIKEENGGFDEQSVHGCSYA